MYSKSYEWDVAISRVIAQNVIFKVLIKMAIPVIPIISERWDLARKGAGCGLSSIRTVRKSYFNVCFVLHEFLSVIGFNGGALLADLLLQTEEEAAPECRALQPCSDTYFWACMVVVVLACGVFFFMWVWKNQSWLTLYFALSNLRYVTQSLQF